MQKRNRIMWVVLFAVWMLIGLSFSINDFMFKGMLKKYYNDLVMKNAPLLEVVYWDLIYWPTWAMLAPLIFWIARRFPIRGKSWYLNVFTTFVAGLVLTLLHRIIYLQIYFLFPVGEKEYSFRELLPYNLPLGFVSYFVILLIRTVTNYALDQKEAARASRLKAESVQAQLAALNMQLQPHFLFNALNSIAALIHEDAKAADKMLARLGDFLRLTLKTSIAQIVTLEEELEFLRGYLQIEEIRLEDKLQVRYELEPQALAAQVPNLILQPSVENAIKYGVQQSLNQVQIVISAKCEGGKLYIQIKDNGEQWQTNEEGIGISNTRARLESVYGSEGRFDLLQTPDGWTVAILEMPFVAMTEGAKVLVS